MTDVDGSLWLVGGQTFSDLFQSTDDGSSWQPIELPVHISGEEAPAFSRLEGGGGEAVITAKNTTETQVIIGRQEGGQWQWHDGPILAIAKYGPGTPAQTSLSDGVLWVLGSSGHIARVDLATGGVSEVVTEELPVGGETAVYATGPETAWASYNTASCAEVKAECTKANGLLFTTDGGESWHELSTGAE